MRASRRTVLSLVAASALLAGCSGDSDDQPVTLPPQTTANPTATPATPPTTTAAAEPTPTTNLLLPDQHVPSADAFVEDFFAALSGIAVTGDFTDYDAMYSPQCSGCVASRAEIETWLSNEQSLEGGQWVILQQNSEEALNGAVVGFRVLAYRTAVSVRDASGESVTEVPVTSVVLSTGALTAGDPWVVEDMSMADPGTG